MQKIILSLSAVLLLFLSCEKMVLGESIENTPENNFELLWQDLDLRYGLFHVRNFNWDSIYTVYRPQVTTKTSEDELWQIFVEMIEYLDDSHTVVIKEDDYYVSGFELGAKAEENWSLELIENKYVDDMTYILEEEFGYGKVKNKDIGYIYLGKEDGFDANRIDKVIDVLGEHKAIVLDMRINGGGSGDISARIAGAFADGERVAFTVQTRNGPEHNNFDEKIPIYTRPIGKTQFLEPVIVLTDRHTISAGEELLIHLKSNAHVVQIGDTTAGDLSDVSNRHFLLNGWSYQFSHQMYLLPDGTSLDGIGHIPDVYIKNEKSDIESGNDLVLERAFEYLFETYGIQ